MTREEYTTAAVLVSVVVMWITLSDRLGMGGPALIGLVALAVFRIIGWRHINKISWDVVALYAGASAMGVGLASTGAALWIADSFIRALPEVLSSGDGLAMASSLFTGVLTNFMSDGATVSALGPVAIPMAAISGTHPWKVGFATAFSSSFANCLIVGTPNNAIVYTLARDPNTGAQLLTLGDFLKHGVVVTMLEFVVLWGWAILGYWRWIGF
jgi:solute carrier family 13 (sodium-dependent dicarboxylate transporter), member 2/3/5